MNSQTKGIIIAIVIIVLILALWFLLKGLGLVGKVTAPPPIYTLASDAQGVPTSIGLRDLPAGTKVGGSPEKFVTITQNVILNTVEEGPKEFPIGTEIPCEPPAPGYPDPCDPY